MGRNLKLQRIKVYFKNGKELEVIGTDLHITVDCNNICEITEPLTVEDQFKTYKHYRFFEDATDEIVTVWNNTAQFKEGKE